MTGAQLRRVRDKLALTQKQFAERLGMHWNTLARWERDELPIRPVVARLVEALVEQDRQARRSKRGATR